MSYSSPPPPPGYGQQNPYGSPAPQGNNQKAIWSLVLGIVGLCCCGFFAGIPAIVLGRMAKQEIAGSGQGGDGMATAGFVLGIIACVWGVVSLILYATGNLTLDLDY